MKIGHFEYLLFIILLNFYKANSLDCVQCSSENSQSCRNNPGVTDRCPEDSRFCVTATYRYPNLQDDSDANYNDHAGRLIKLERGCEKSDSQPGCQNKMLGNVAVVECRDYCDHDGCNSSQIKLVCKTLVTIIFMIYLQ